MQARPKAHSSCRICTCSRRRPRRKTAVAGCLRGWTRKSPAAASSIASSFCARSRSTFSATSPMRTRNRASATCMALVARSQGTVNRALVPLLFRTHEPPWQCKYAKGATAPARGGAWSRAEASGCHLVAALAYSGEPARLAIGASSMSSHSLLACLLVFSPLMYQSCCGLVTGLFDLALPLVSVSRSADAQVAGMLAITPFSTIPHSRIADLDYLDGICSISTTGSC